MTTVACVFVKGHVPFTVEYVFKLQAMVARWMDRPYRFVCLTDRPYLLTGMDTLKIPSPGKMKGWWSKVRLFDPFLGLDGRVLYLDLDTLLVAPLQPILDYPSAFALAPDGAPDFHPTGSRAVVKRFNSSVMVWDAPSCADVFLKWKPAVTDRLWGDQDWIGEQCPDAEAMPGAWFPRISAIGDGPIPDEAKVVLMKKPKNAEAAAVYPWVAERWVA